MVGPGEKMSTVVEQLLADRARALAAFGDAAGALCHGDIGRALLKMDVCKQVRGRGAGRVSV